VCFFGGGAGFLGGDFGSGAALRGCGAGDEAAVTDGVPGVGDAAGSTECVTSAGSFGSAAGGGLATAVGAGRGA